MKAYNLGLIAIASVLAAGNAGAAEGDRTPSATPASAAPIAAIPVSATPLTEVLVVTAKRPSAASIAEVVAADPVSPLAEFQALTVAPKPKPRIETPVDLPALQELEIELPRIELALGDIEDAMR